MTKKKTSEKEELEKLQERRMRFVNQEDPDLAEIRNARRKAMQALEAEGEAKKTTPKETGEA